MRLYFIRHGQSTNNAISHLPREEIELKRAADPELTAIGKQQAEYVAEFLANSPDEPLPDTEPFNITHMYVSPMIRAMDTAKPIADALNLKPQIWKDICEIGGLFKSDGKGNVRGYPGMTRNEISERYPNYILSDDITDIGWWNVNAGRETPDQFYARALRVAMTFNRRINSTDGIVIVAHAAFLDGLMKALLSQIPTHPNALFYSHYNTGITRLDFSESKYTDSLDHLRIHYMNRVDHLPPELRTW